jgi:hypothetical protein
MIVHTEGATKAQEDEAEMIVGVLSTVYPGYPWSVRVYDGGFFIRNLDFPANWGMNCKFSTFSHDAAVLKREIVMKAGEFLERANLKRGRNNGDEIQWVEGVPDKDQPPSSKSPIILNG